VKIKYQDRCPFCDFVVKSYEEFVPHMEQNHPDDYFMLLYENNTIEIIQVDSIEEITKVEDTDEI